MSIDGRTYALTKPWWTWDHEVISNALETARFRAWLPIVRRLLRENAQMGHHPGSFGQLRDAVARDLRNLKRVFTGEYALTNQTALGLAVALKLSMQTFFPEASDWITRTVLVLCEGKLSEAEARVYVAYRSHEPATGNPHLDTSAVRLVFDELHDGFSDTGAAERAISRAADVLGDILETLPGEKRK